MFCAIVDPIPTVSVTVNSDMNAGKLGDRTVAVRAASAAGWRAVAPAEVASGVGLAVWDTFCGVGGTDILARVIAGRANRLL